MEFELGLQADYTSTCKRGDSRVGIREWHTQKDGDTQEQDTQKEPDSGAKKKFCSIVSSSSWL